MTGKKKKYLCELCIVDYIEAESEEDAVSEMAERIANMNTANLEDFIVAQTIKDEEGNYVQIL